MIGQSWLPDFVLTFDTGLAGQHENLSSTSEMLYTLRDKNQRRLAQINDLQDQAGDASGQAARIRDLEAQLHTAEERIKVLAAAQADLPPHLQTDFLTRLRKAEAAEATARRQGGG